MAPFFLMLGLVFLSSLMVLRALILPAAHLLPWIFPIHLTLYFIAFCAMIIVLYGRLHSSTRSESGFRFFAGAYFFSFLGFHSLLLSALFLHFLSVVLFHFAYIPSAVFFIAVAYVLAALGVGIARLGPRLERTALGTAGEPSIAILQISDLHIGATVGKNYVRRVVEQSLAAKPDCIVLTGDIGDGHPDRHRAAIAELAKLKAPLGVYVVLGNHEYYWPTAEWVKAFEAAGFIMLVDEALVLDFLGKKITLLGLAPMRGKKIADLMGEEIIENLVVLSHYPHRADEAAAASARLFLAGHTHGGQFWPWSWVIHFFHRYAKGLYRVGETDVYVNRGTGYWGPPFRFGARAEITVIELEI